MPPIVGGEGVNVIVAVIIAVAGVVASAGLTRGRPPRTLPCPLRLVSSNAGRPSCCSGSHRRRLRGLHHHRQWTGTDPKSGPLPAQHQKPEEKQTGRRRQVTLQACCCRPRCRFRCRRRLRGVRKRCRGGGRGKGDGQVDSKIFGSSGGGGGSRGGMMQQNNATGARCGSGRGRG